MRKNGVDISLEYLVSEKPDAKAASKADITDAGLAGWARPAERLQQALEKDGFSLYCQPILALDPAARPTYPLGEVLVRMAEEEQAMLPPGEFLPVLEHYRMMPELDRWVVRHLAKRLAAGAALPGFTMNVSGQTLEDAEFPAYVADVLKAARLAPGALVFEVEEHELLGRPQVLTPFAAAVRAGGAALLIDGYGRKSVSFTPLAKLRPEYVKVEGSIVRKLLKSTVAQTKLEAIVRVAQTMGVKVIAECVEEPEVLEKLRAMKVGYAQGFGLVQPQPIDSLPKQ
jgi:EAL domain-containing protein (putative c-di-GMP-specific phosphodiesterase class I)